MKEIKIVPQSKSRFPKLNFLNKFKKLVLFTVVILLAGAFAYYASSYKQAIPKIEDKSNWNLFQSNYLKLSFSFPAIPGEVKYQFNEWPSNTEPSGTLYLWEVKRTDIDSRGYKYIFAGGASKDMGIGRSRWVTDNYKWFIDGGKYYVEQNGGYKFQVDPLKIVIREDGLEGIIFDPNSSFWSKDLPAINPKKEDRAAILNLPSGHNDKLGSITFYFYDKTSLEDIEKVLRSVSFWNLFQSSKYSFEFKYPTDWSIKETLEPFYQAYVRGEGLYFAVSTGGTGIEEPVKIEKYNLVVDGITTEVKDYTFANNAWIIIFDVSKYGISHWFNLGGSSETDRGLGKEKLFSILSTFKFTSKTYVNAFNKYSFEYPSHWFLIPSQRTDSVVPLASYDMENSPGREGPSNPSNFKIDIVILNHDRTLNLNLDQFIEHNDRNNEVVINSKTTVVNQLYFKFYNGTGIKREIINSSNGARVWEVYIAAENKVILIAAHRNDTFEDVFNDLARSFRIL